MSNGRYAIKYHLVSKQLIVANIKVREQQRGCRQYMGCEQKVNCSQVHICEQGSKCNQELKCEQVGRCNQRQNREQRKGCTQVSNCERVRATMLMKPNGGLRAIICLQPVNYPALTDGAS